MPDNDELKPFLSEHKNPPGGIKLFLALSILAFLLIASIYALKIYGSHLIHPHNAVSVYVLIFILIWSTGLAILPSLPGNSDKWTACSWIIIHGALIAGRVATGHEMLPSLSVLALDFAIAALLMIILKRKKTKNRWAFLYVFNPCVLSGLMVCPPSVFAWILSFNSILFFYLSGRYRLMFALAGLQTFFSPFSIPALLLLLNKKNLKNAWLIIPFIVASIPAFFLVPDINRFFPVAHSFETIIKTGAFDHIIRFLFHARKPEFLNYCLIVPVILTGLLIFHPALNPRYRDNPFPGLFFTVSTMTVFLHGVPFSLFICLAQLVIFRPSIMWLLLGFTVFPYAALSGLAGSTPAFFPGLQADFHPVFKDFIIWLPLYISLPFACYRAVQQQKRFKRNKAGEEIRTLSVIIPALNEETGIGRCIRHIRMDDAVTEIIVVDGGSSDKTVEIALKESAEVIVHKKPFNEGGGRGGQIKAGLDHASGDAIAVVHADSVVNAPVFRDIIDALNSNPDVAGGAVGCRFDSEESKFRIIEFANNARMAYLGIAFGDQLQFFRRKPVIDNNTFPEIPLMEDVELSMRLKNLGAQLFLFGNVQVSTRRWQKKGFRNAIWVIKTVSRYIWNRIWEVPDSSSLYRDYYQIGDNKKGV